MNSKSKVESRKSMGRVLKRFALFAVFPFFFSLGMTGAHAQGYPTKPIRLIVPLAPGGGNDTIARLIGQKIQGPLGQQVVVENRPGAGGLIGAELVAKAPPDGYTLLLGNAAQLTVIPNVQANAPYSPTRDFAPVSLIASAPLLVVVHPSLPVRSIKQLVALAKAQPDQLNYASNGFGSTTQFATELFKLMTGTRMEHVPYKGLSLAMVDLVSGRVHLMFSSAVAMLPTVKEGKLRAIAMTGSKRSQAIPDIPTVAESGVKDFESGSWYGILAPAGTPRPIVERLNREIIVSVKSQDIQDRLVHEAVIPIGSSPEEFSAHIKKEFGRAARVIKESGAKFN
ncbi:MAG TPA: tripartite tricarboxylate transporter substrate binding protein [Burkholderiales bacterium]|nr:tripartite tricarboxylate transporter substrate binding protein [Burkholderiales bacterium]